MLPLKPDPEEERVPRRHRDDRRPPPAGASGCETSIAIQEPRTWCLGTGGTCLFLPRLTTALRESAGSHGQDRGARKRDTAPSLCQCRASGFSKNGTKHSVDLGSIELRRALCTHMHKHTYTHVHTCTHKHTCAHTRTHEKQKAMFIWLSSEKSEKPFSFRTAKSQIQCGGRFAKPRASATLAIKAS